MKDAQFGRWGRGRCIPFDAQNSEVQEVGSKEECWQRVFTNPKVADDSPTTYPSSSQNSWNDFWPVHESSAPKSGKLQEIVVPQNCFEECGFSRTGAAQLAEPAQLKAVAGGVGQPSCEAISAAAVSVSIHECNGF